MSSAKPSKAREGRIDKMIKSARIGDACKIYMYDEERRARVIETGDGWFRIRFNDPVLVPMAPGAKKQPKRYTMKMTRSQLAMYYSFKMLETGIDKATKRMIKLKEKTLKGESNVRQ